MKRNAFVLIILCVAFLLIICSCESTSQNEDEVDNTPSQRSIFEYVVKENTQIPKTHIASVVLPNNESNFTQTDDFIVTQTISGDLVVYQIVFCESGEVINTFLLPRYPGKGKMGRMSFYQEGEYLIVKCNYQLTVGHTYKIIDKDGNIILDQGDAYISTDTIRFYGTHFKVGDILYRIDKSKATVVADVTNLYYSTSLIENAKFAGGRYVAINKEENRILVFDSHLAFEGYFDIPMHHKMIWLNSGNILFIQKEAENEEFNLEDEGGKYKLSHCLFNAESQCFEKTQQDFILLSKSVKIEGIAIDEGYTLVMGKTIENRKTGGTVYAIANEQGNIVCTLKSPLGLLGVEMTNDGNYLVTFKESEKLYAPDHTEITKSDAEYIGCGYYKIEKMIYNSQMELVLDLSQYENVKYLPNGTVFFYGEFDEDVTPPLDIILPEEIEPRSGLFDGDGNAVNVPSEGFVDDIIKNQKPNFWIWKNGSVIKEMHVTDFSVYLWGYSVSYRDAVTYDKAIDYYNSDGTLLLTLYSPTNVEAYYDGTTLVISAYARSAINKRTVYIYS